MIAENITEGENAIEMDHAESDVDDDSDPDYSPDDSFHESEEEGDSGDEWETITPWMKNTSVRISTV